MSLNFLILLCLMSSIAAYSVLNVYESVCGVDVDCKVGYYCHKSGRKLGYCTEKTQDGGRCVMDRICKSGNCHFFKCLAKYFNVKVLQKNGFCSNDSYCHFEQYCEDNFCNDRKLDGWCKSDSQCLSNDCSIFRCEKPQKY